MGGARLLLSVHKMVVGTHFDVSDSLATVAFLDGIGSPDIPGSCMATLTTICSTAVLVCETIQSSPRRFGERLRLQIREGAKLKLELR